MLLLIASAITLKVLEDNMLFFYTTSQAFTKKPTKTFRLGGMIESHMQTGVEHQFVLTDLSHSITVKYHGILPQLFKEGQGAIVIGKFNGDVFMANEVLAKHDEKYMPKELYPLSQDNK